jgi:hypothetical protein
MTANQMAILFGVFVLGLFIGFSILALVVTGMDEDIDIPRLGTQDTELLDYLETSKLNIFFNPSLSAWGLLDDTNKLISSSPNLRVTIASAKGAV